MNTGIFLATSTSTYILMNACLTPGIITSNNNNFVPRLTRYFVFAKDTGLGLQGGTCCWEKTISWCHVQIELYGKLSDSMTVSVTLMLVYITKFFWWEAGYWNSMDIAHDRGKFHYHACLLTKFICTYCRLLSLNVTYYILVTYLHIHRRFR